MTNRIARAGTIRLLDEAIDVGANARLIWRVHRPFIWLLLATAILDALSTIAFMAILGVDREQNPFIRQLAHWLGIVAGPAAGKLAQLFAAGILALVAPRLARLVFTVAISLNLFAYVVNMHVFMLNL